ncbi:hypothetical protein SAMN05421805_10578 [Saccharopolyspora antimicrobica]|uniref:Uncharacterized protein n=1 Tax=Saccharopolyspora antimicrobica TaxID=455193 RepID=A0A1I4ZQU0_9PSEU|nr:hypothetical protein [Saccharopolyspora antimicrobica]RKT83436.1 hypothetical protein ATL45_1719 [Saccharopolyspora antimicrobica]SFN52645.1 hypothetical protein SAMN05421805_10578 [Saccharopolyspora antimicrobica]
MPRNAAAPAGGLAPDYQERLAVWDTFHDIRVATALGAFALVIIAVQLAGNASRTAVSA